MTDAATDTSTEAEQATGGATAPARTAATTIERPGSLPTKAQQSAASKDKTLTSPAAVEMAHGALSEITDPLSVGAHAGARCDAERVVTHLFECNLAGYRGWRWAVTLTRPPRSRTATVCEMELLPGEDALLAPAWVPWADRLQPGDVSRSDRLPRRETDERLEPGWEATGEHAGDQAGEDGLLAAGTDAVDFGRARVLSAEGVQRAADRWYAGDHGPDADGVRKAHATCSTCGFFMPLSGPLRNVFGICANEWAADDGRVVSLDHGCGAHSETDVPDQGPDWPVTPSRLDEAAMEPIGSDGASIREGRSLTEVAADDQPAVSEPTEDAGGDPAASADGAQDDAADSSEAATDPRSEAPAPDAEPAPDAGEPAPRSSRSRRSSRSGRSSGRRTRRSDAEEEATTETAAPERQDASAPTDGEQRHSSALDAVAQLTAFRGHADDADADGAPTTLAELEAHLPRRD